MTTLQSNQASYDEIQDLTYEDGFGDGGAAERNRCLAWIREAELNFMHPEFGTLWADLFTDEQVPTVEKTEQALSGLFKGLIGAIESSKDPVNDE